MQPTLDLPCEMLSFPSRAEWLAARLDGIGSSDVPAIVGVSRFHSPLSLYYEKLGLNEQDPRYVEASRWGQLLEEPISQRYAEESKRVVRNPNEGGVFTIARSRQHPFMLASVDRLIVSCPPIEGAPRPPADGIGVLEAKNAHLMMQDEWLTEHNNEPPVEYQVQLQHQLAGTGLQWGSIAALIGGCIFVWADLPRDNALIDSLVEMEKEFLRRLVLRDPPPADASFATREVLKKIYPKDSGESVMLPADAIDWHNGLVGAKAAKKMAELDEDRFANLLRQAIGDASVGVLPGGGGYTLKSQERKEFISPRTEFRVLRYTKK